MAAFLLSGLSVRHHSSLHQGVAEARSELGILAARACDTFGGPGRGTGGGA